MDSDQWRQSAVAEVGKRHTAVYKISTDRQQIMFVVFTLNWCILVHFLTNRVVNNAIYWYWLLYKMPISFYYCRSIATDFKILNLVLFVLPILFPILVKWLHNTTFQYFSRSPALRFIVLVICRSTELSLTIIKHCQTSSVDLRIPSSIMEHSADHNLA